MTVVLAEPKPAPAVQRRSKSPTKAVPRTNGRGHVSQRSLAKPTPFSLMECIDATIAANPHIHDPNKIGVLVRDAVPEQELRACLGLVLGQQVAQRFHAANAAVERKARKISAPVALAAPRKKATQVVPANWRGAGDVCREWFASNVCIGRNKWKPYGECSEREVGLIMVKRELEGDTKYAEAKRHKMVIAEMRKQKVMLAGEISDESALRIIQWRP